MDSKTDTPSEKPSETPQDRPGLLVRLLKWLTRGAEKAARDGSICTT